jgi:L1 cell adhesion molecule like protein
MLQIEELAENDTFVVAQRNLKRSVSKPFASLSR